MAVDHHRDFIGVAEEAEARRTSRRVYLAASGVALLLGLGLVSLLIYGPILIDNGVVELTVPPSVTVHSAPTPTVP